MERTAVGPNSLLQQSNEDSAPPRGSGRHQRTGNPVLGAIAPVITGALVVGVWEGVRRLGNYPSFILPSPVAVAIRLSEAWVDGTLPRNMLVTLNEASVGFGIALAGALVLGYILAKVAFLEVLVAPLIASSQAVPAVAIAPLLVLWLGVGIAPKVAVVTVIVFFPLLVTTISGLRGVEKDMLEVARVFGASRRQIFWYVEIPRAAPALLSGLKLGLTLSITGAVVGEFIAADSGLGYLINWSREGSFDTSLLFASLLVLMLLSSVLYGAVSLLERIVLRWRD